MGVKEARPGGVAVGARIAGVKEALRSGVAEGAGVGVALHAVTAISNTQSALLVKRDN